MERAGNSEKDVIRFVRLLIGQKSDRGQKTEQIGSEILIRSAGKSARLETASVLKLVRQGVLTLRHDLPVANELTRPWLRRVLCKDPAGETLPFANQHRHTQPRSVRDEEGTVPFHLICNDHESPLAKLALLKKRDKTPYISQHHIVAGERLRRDFDKAHLGAHMVMRWDAGFSSSKSAGGGGSDISDMAIDARARLNKCYAVMGTELAGVLIDFCGYLKGLETIELERGWPRRSAKLAIRLALDQLACHYGLDEGVSEAEGRRTGAVQSWGDKPTGFGAAL